MCFKARVDPFVCMFCCLWAMGSPDSPLAWHLLTSSWPVWQSSSSNPHTYKQPSMGLKSKIYRVIASQYETKQTLYWLSHASSTCSKTFKILFLFQRGYIFPYLCNIHFLPEPIRFCSFPWLPEWWEEIHWTWCAAPSHWWFFSFLGREFHLEGPKISLAISRNWEYIDIYKRKRNTQGHTSICRAMNYLSVCNVHFNFIYWFKKLYWHWSSFVIMY